MRALRQPERLVGPVAGTFDRLPRRYHGIRELESQFGAVGHQSSAVCRQP
jgi:hypothetical protein